MRILLAEDEIALAKVLVKIFESNNYSIDAVHDGQEALDYLEAGNYDAESRRDHGAQKAARIRV